MSYTKLKASIIEVIEQSALIDPAFIYNYEPTQPGGFPAISVTALTGDGVFADTLRNRRNYILRIRCYQERDTVGDGSGLVPQSEAERIMGNLVDSLIGIFDQYANFQLDNTVPGLVFVQPIPSEWGYTQAPNANMRTADIKLNAVVVK
jgi:hypothetical protein